MDSVVWRERAIELVEKLATQPLVDNGKFDNLLIYKARELVKERG